MGTSSEDNVFNTSTITIQDPDIRPGSMWVYAGCANRAECACNKHIGEPVIIVRVYAYQGYDISPVVEYTGLFNWSTCEGRDSFMGLFTPVPEEEAALYLIST